MPKRRVHDCFNVLQRDAQTRQKKHVYMAMRAQRCSVLRAIDAGKTRRKVGE